MKQALTIIIVVSVLLPMLYMAFRSADLLGQGKLSLFVETQGVIGYPSPIYIEHISQSDNDALTSLMEQVEHISSVSLEQGTLFDGLFSSLFSPLVSFANWFFNWLGDKI